MTRQLNFTRTQEKEREGVFVYLGMEERWVYIVVIKEICMEGNLLRVEKES